MPLRIVTLLIVGLVMAGCTSPTNSAPTATSVSYTMDSSAATQVSEFANSTYTSVTMNLSLGTTPHNVYLAFTNRGTSATGSKPSVTSGDVGTGSKSVADTTAASEEVSSDVGTVTTQNDLAFSTRLPQAIRSTKAVSQSRSLSPSASTSITTAASSSYTVGSTGKTFRYQTYDGTLVSSHTFTLVSQVTNTAQNRIVNVWVDSSLYGTTVTSAMVAALAPLFLASGTATGSDIYSWDTGIFGREYYEPGTAVASDLVTPTGVIDIVLADLNPNRANQSSFVYGYYWAVNDFQSYTAVEDYEGQEASNASISFYLDAPIFAKLGTGETSWAITNTYPSAMVSTLAHEFQHMIQYYQKQLTQGVDTTDTWINEMCSMEAEDLLADKLGVTGPRGVPVQVDGTFNYATGSLTATSSLSANDKTNRIALFNRYYPALPLTGSSSYSVYDYSMAYSFGSWLARNYGGAALFRSLVQNSGTDINAVVDAVNAVNATSVTWAQLLREWAASVVASDAVMSVPYALQTAEPYYFMSTLTSAVTTDSLTFWLGSIDYSKYYAYRASTSEPLSAGPYLSSSFSGLTSIPAAGLYLLRPLSSATGTHTLTLTVPASVDVTVVTKVSS
jgi:hypothetical protein